MTDHVLSSRDTLDLAFTPGAGAQGHVQAVRRGIKARGGQYPVPAPGLERLLHDSAEKKRVVRASHQHPGRDPRAQNGAQPRTTGLSPAEVAWLQNLPKDPAQVAYADAVQLARLARTLRPTSGNGGEERRGDLRLVHQVYAPVEELHDRLLAKAELSNAQASRPEVPHSALGAVAEAIGSEVPGLRENEALQRASEAIADRAASHEADRRQRIVEAERKLATVDAATEARTSPQARADVEGMAVS